MYICSCVPFCVCILFYLLQCTFILTVLFNTFRSCHLFNLYSDFIYMLDRKYFFLSRVHFYFVWPLRCFLVLYNILHCSAMCHPSFMLTSLFCILLFAIKFQRTSITSSFATISAETATAQFSMLNVIPISFFFTSLRSKTQKIVSCSLVILLFYVVIFISILVLVATLSKYALSTFAPSSIH